ncbi:mannose-1-phosphate guanylyltransferase/mannose-6-phosphate isomerase [Limnobacter sp. MED105]|uniref:mannose-1-phosphate guanylyltransferase/mannose-6-phosphate isomerase n=1 Tax=Limnobacter sp. MED105 TaxID=391597 RepID=UPI000156C6E9|nr:mannose-1-phosphate guanylyltransferase/mannose-6-phosphate isomerase [Limnobacter sp. MED105]EDM85060.1 Mannose-1-phosphate guanylyltransferase/mannose-6-phosphate isomerase [Limnobacter sp. MED105]
MSNSKRVIPVILCGGAGTRLWPLSRKNFPKPFLKVGAESLIAQTVRRAAAVAKAADSSDVLLVSNESYQFLLQDECMPVLNSEGSNMALHQLLEPQGRNTAPAIALAAQWAQARYPDENPVLLVLPADHLINPVAEFVRVAQQAVAAARKGWLTCFGITPSTPETGFGYIQQGAPVDEINGAFAVQRFVEKPKLELAMEYLASGQYVWNGGMFALRSSDLLQALENNEPNVATQANAVWASAKESKSAKASGSVFTFNKDEFANLPDISIDYAVMEKASNVAVVAASFQWSDIGSWAALAEQCTPDTQGNTVQQEGAGQLISIDSNNTHVRLGNRAVATLGVENLLIVDTPDALLVADKSRHQDVKKVVETLKAQGSELVNLHPTVHRPWGTYTVLEDSAGYKIKRIEVKPGASLSLQMHHHRSEHWIVVSGTAEVTNGENVFLVRKNESTYIPAGNRHRLVNPGVLNLVMIEVQSGDYLEEDDIVRFDDVYGRA